MTKRLLFAAIAAVFLLAGCVAVAPDAQGAGYLHPGPWLAALSDITPTPSQRAWQHMEAGREAMEAADYWRAVREYERAIALDRNLVEAHFGLGNAYLELQQLYEAERLYRYVLRLDPGHADAQANLGVVLYQQGRYIDAEAAFGAGLVLSPDDAELHYLLAASLLKQGRPEAAKEELDLALALSPELPEAWYGLGLYFKATGDPEQAIAAFERFLTLPDVQDPLARPGAERELAALRAAALMGELSGAALTLEDLPRGFIEIPPEQMIGAYGDAAPVHILFAFVSIESFEPPRYQVVLGFAMPSLTDAEIGSAGLSLMYALFVAEYGQDMRDVDQLTDLDGIGEAAAGFTGTAEVEGTLMQVDSVLFRRGTMLVSLITTDLEGGMPAVSVVDLARTFDAHLAAITPSGD